MRRQNQNLWLQWAAALTVAAALMHVLMLLGGPEWYRWFGAGERMVTMAAQGHWFPPVLTSMITLVLFSWAAYAWSGAGMMCRLPAISAALALVSLVFYLRALAGLWLVHAPPSVDPYFIELQQRPLFLWGSSLYCLVLATCYSMGLLKLRRSMQRTRWNQLSG
jgi:hypothetical protein